MPIEAALIKPLVDVLMGLFRQGDSLRLKHNAEAALREAIRELLMADPNDGKAEARIAVAKAAGILSEDVALAEDMLKKHRATRSRTRGKAATGRRRLPTPDAGAGVAATPAADPLQDPGTNALVATPVAGTAPRKRPIRAPARPDT